MCCCILSPETSMLPTLSLPYQSTQPLGPVMVELFAAPAETCHTFTTRLLTTCLVNDSNGWELQEKTRSSYSCGEFIETVDDLQLLISFQPFDTLLAFLACSHLGPRAIDSNFNTCIMAQSKLHNAAHLASRCICARV